MIKCTLGWHRSDGDIDVFDYSGISKKTIPGRIEPEDIYLIHKFYYRKSPHNPFVNLFMIMGNKYCYVNGHSHVDKEISFSEFKKFIRLS